MACLYLILLFRLEVPREYLVIKVHIKFHVHLERKHTKIGRGTRPSQEKDNNEIVVLPTYTLNSILLAT